MEGTDKNCGKEVHLALIRKVTHNMFTIQRISYVCTLKQQHLIGVCEKI